MVLLHSSSLKGYHMKVALYHNNSFVEIIDRPIPEPNETEIIVKTQACGVCVADTMEWYLRSRAPLPLGHEPTGVVAKVGNKVDKFKVGDRVAVHHHIPCLVCEHCLRGNYTMCSKFRSTNISPGGFSEYFRVSEEHIERDVHILPSHVSFATGTLIEPLACVLHAIKKAKITHADSVILIGTGVMGLMFIQALLHLGVRDIVVYELIEWRKKKAIEFGAKNTFAPLKDINAEKDRVASLIGEQGADKVIIAAKDINAMKMGMNLVNKGGTLLFFATPHPDESIPLFPSHLFFNEITITSSYSADHKDTRDALKLISRGIINADELISHTYPLEDLAKAIQQTAGRGESLKNVIVFG